MDSRLRGRKEGRWGHGGLEGEWVKSRRELGDEAGALEGDVVDGVFQPCHAAVGEEGLGLVYEALLVADSRRVGGVFSARKDEGGASDAGEQQGGFVLPQGADDFHVVVAAEVGPGVSLRGHVEVGGENLFRWWESL